MGLLAFATAGCGLADRVTGVQGYTQSGESMEPTIKKGQHFKAHTVNGDYVPRVGDIVVYRPPAGWGDTEPRVSRVIGVPGSSVRCCDSGGNVVVDGKPLNEPYLTSRPASSQMFDIRVPAGRIWIMSDHRGVAVDSRAHQDAPGAGTIATADVIGKL